MRDEDLQEMRHLPLFEGVGAAYVESLLRSAFVQRFPAHVELVHEGDPADFLYVIVQGQVEIYAGYRDRETTISVLGPGNSFIIAAVLLDRVYLKSARGLTPTRILMLPADAVRDGFAEDAHFARALRSIWRCLSRRGQGTEEPEIALQPRAAGQLADHGG